MINNKLSQNVGDRLTKAEPHCKKQPEVRNWPQEKRKLRSKVDPFTTLVLLYLIFSITCLLWFGWKYYILRREVARLSEIVVTLYGENAGGPAVNLPEQNDPANIPLSGGQKVPDRTDTAAASLSPVNSTIYTIKAGDTWWKISENSYGVGTYYLKLSAYNKMSNQRLYKGMVVEIPPREVLDALQ